MRLFTFDNSTEAYDATQTRDDISDGDVIVVPSENIVGYLVQAWPVAVTREAGPFARWVDQVEAKYARSQAFAEDVARIVPGAVISGAHDEEVVR